MKSGGLTSSVRSSYRLVLSNLVDEVTRDIGENVFFVNLPTDYMVYLFYYPSVIPNEELENNLKLLGRMTGNNLFVNIGRLDDPSFSKVKRTFGIVDLPVIIMTGLEGIASVKTQRYYSTAYVRIDSSRLLQSVDLTTKSVERIFNLFVGGELSQALAQYQRDKRIALLKLVIVNSLKKIVKFLSDRDISVSLIEGKLELKRNGGSDSE
jgi:hypothetical protein